MQTYSPAAEVQEMAGPIIAAYHPMLVDATIRYLFTSEPRTNKGAIVWGSLQLVGGLHAYLSTEEIDPYFVLLIDFNIWGSLTEAARAALIDHELCHGGKTSKGKWGMRGHDLEEFAAIIARHGFWREDVVSFMDAAKQGDLWPAHPAKNEAI